MTEPDEMEAAEIEGLEARARLLRDRIASSVSGESDQGDVRSLRSELAMVEAQLARAKSAHRI